MIKEIVWTQSAWDDIHRILAHFLEQEGEEVAAWVYRRIRQAAWRLQPFPQSGRRSRREGFRELVVKDLSYVLFYTIQNERVYIARVLHTSRQPLQ